MDNSVHHQNPAKKTPTNNGNHNSNTHSKTAIIKVQRTQNIDKFFSLSHAPSTGKTDLGAVNHKDGNIVTYMALDTHKPEYTNPTVWTNDRVVHPLTNEHPIFKHEVANSNPVNGLTLNNPSASPYQVHRKVFCKQSKGS